MQTIETRIADIIYASAGRISDEIVNLQQAKWAGVSSKYGMTRSKHSGYCHNDLYQLAEALMANNPPQYARYIAWLRSMFKSHQVPEFFVDLNIETERATLKKILPPECHPVISRFMPNTGEAHMEKDEFKPSFAEDRGVNTELAKEFLRVLLAGERGKASGLISGAIDSGISIRDIYLQVLKPCLYEVGRMWQTAQITVAHEHFFSAATQFLMSELYPRIHKHVSPGGRVAVAACVEGELHEIGLRMISDLLELEGWRTFYLGANTPALSVVEIAREKKAQVLALSICLPSSGPALRELISAARERLANEVKIVIGGYSISIDPVYAASFGADGIAGDTEAVTTMLDRLVSGGRAIAG